MRQAIIACLLFIAAGAAQGKQIVWEQPTTEFSTSYGDGFFNLALDITRVELINLALDITRVELKENETLVYMTVSQRSDYDDYWFQFASGSYLKADGKQYAITSADGIQLDTHQQTGPDGTSEVVLHFEPLPLSTKSFDFTEGDFSGAFQRRMVHHGHQACGGALAPTAAFLLARREGRLEDCLPRGPSHI